MLPVFINAFSAKPPIVLKKQLRPLTVGHAFLLAAGGNTFAPDSPGPRTLDDFYAAVLICSNGFRDGIAAIHSAAGMDFTEWGRDCEGLDVAEEIRKFSDYILTYSDIPKRRTTPDSKPYKCPWQLAVAANIVGTGPLTPDATDKAMDMPLSEAFAWSAVRGEIQNGDDTLLTEADFDALEQFRNMPEPPNVKR